MKKPSKRIKVAVIDSFYCSLDHYKKKYPNIVIKYPLSEASSTMNCVGEFNRGLHGHLVFENLLYQLQDLDKYEFHLITVFDTRGFQLENLWRRAASYIKKKEIPVTLSAAGYYKSDNLSNLKFEGMMFLSAGNWGRGIKETTKLYPQVQNRSNYYIVGAFSSPTAGANRHQYFVDPMSLNQKITDFYMENSGEINNLRGTSYSLTLAASTFLNNCSTQIKSKCLLQLIKPAKFSFKGSELPGNTLRK